MSEPTARQIAAQQVLAAMEPHKANAEAQMAAVVDLVATLTADLAQARQTVDNLVRNAEAWKLAYEVEQQAKSEALQARDAALANEGETLKRLSLALTGGNAGTWDEVFHAAESAARTALLEAAEEVEKGQRVILAGAVAAWLRSRAGEVNAANVQEANDKYQESLVFNLQLQDIINEHLDTITDLKAQLSEARRQVWEEAIRVAQSAASAPIAGPTYREGYEDGKQTAINALIQRALPSEQTETPR